MADKRLQVFHTVAKLLSFTKAAEVLQMTQPAVTFQIRQLEESFNVRLFDRSHNKIDLTEAGRRMFEYSEKLFELYREMENAIREVSGNVSGKLRIGATVAIGDYVLPRLLIAFKQNFPDINIQLKLANTSSIATMVENSSIDIGIVDTHLDNKLIGTDNITYDEMVVVCSSNHELAGEQEVSIEQLVAYPLVLLEQTSGINYDFRKYLMQHDLKYDQLNILMELGSIEAIKNAVESSLGISVLPTSALSKELELNTLKAITLKPSFTNTLSFVYKKQKFPELNIQELMQFAHDYYGASSSNKEDFGANQGHAQAVNAGSSFNTDGLQHNLLGTGSGMGSGTEFNPDASTDPTSGTNNSGNRF